MYYVGLLLGLLFPCFWEVLGILCNVWLSRLSSHLPVPVTEKIIEKFLSRLNRRDLYFLLFPRILITWQSWLTHDCLRLPSRTNIMCCTADCLIKALMFTGFGHLFDEVKGNACMNRQ